MILFPAADWPSCFFQVNEIYHDESLGVHINVVLVRMIMLGYAKVRRTITMKRTPVLFGMTETDAPIGFLLWFGFVCFILSPKTGALS